MTFVLKQAREYRVIYLNLQWTEAVILSKYAKNFKGIKPWAIFLLVLSLYSPFNLATESKNVTPENSSIKPWKLWRNKGDIQIRYRASDHKNLIEIKAQAKLASSLAGFLYFIEDLKQMPNWLDNAKSARIIQQISPNENVFITQLRGIWPVSAREMIVHSRYWQNDDLSVEIAVTDASDTLPVNKKYVRMHVISGHWKIVPVQPGHIAITYQFIVDPKGNIPQWLSKNITRNGILTTFKNLKEQLPSSHWQQKSKSNIRELQ